ncbi:MAG: sigma-70 family RNA polymerase sigma factor [Lachnospiraceae bacterium]|nr:sigma-70 family RNA polymerase sigma factor [Lachnospiraceae bacterium]
MKNSSARPAYDIEALVNIYGDMLFRLCVVMLGSETDAEDAVQETFIRYMQKAPDFENSEHEKAWLITTAKNKCRDMLRFRQKHPQISIEYMQGLSSDSTDSGILEALMSLPEKFRLVLTLYYVEEYRIDDIARIIRKTPSAVKMRLQKGRKLLEEKYRKEYL